MDVDTPFDPFDPAHQSVHHEKMAELRARCPVARLASGVAVVSRHENVKAALQDTHLRNRNAARSPGVDVPPEDRFFFFEYDPPHHLPLRRLLLDLLSRQRAEQSSPATSALFEELLTPLVSEGRGELVSQLSVPFGGRLMMRVAGFPEADAPQWRSWIKDMVSTGFSFSNRNERGTGFAECYPDLLTYLDERIGARLAAADKPSDVLSRVTTAELDGAPLDRTIQRMILFSVVSGGTNTLVNFFSNTFLSLARSPHVLEGIRRDRSLIPRAVEESLRRDAPSMYLTRVCSQDVEIAGTPLSDGERVLVGLASANRDEQVYPEPTEFRLDRDEQPGHLAFGWGGHLCVGAPIVREAGATMLNAFVDRVGSIEVERGTTPVPYLSPQGNGLDELHVRLTPRAVRA